MENLNKIISLLIGLVIVIVFFAVLSGRINLRNLTNLGRSTAKISPTLTPVPTKKVPTPSPTLSYQVNRNQSQTGSSANGSVPNKIPSTGLPSVFIPSLITALLAGIALSRKN